MGQQPERQPQRLEILIRSANIKLIGSLWNPGVNESQKTVLVEFDTEQRMGFALQHICPRQCERIVLATEMEMSKAIVGWIADFADREWMNEEPFWPE